MEQKQNKSYGPQEISPSFKIFISVFVIVGLLIFGYFLLQQGESLPEVITLLFAIIGAVALFLIGGAKAFKRIQSLSALSPTEQKYSEDLNRILSKIGILVSLFKDLPNGIQTVVNFLIILGYILKWLLFWLFAGSFVLVVANKDTIAASIFMLCFAAIWCPWLENLILKKINYKVAFTLKLLLLIALAYITIIFNP